MTGNGFELDLMGSYSMAFLGIVILAFIIMFTRKWIGEEMDFGFNTLFASLGAGLGYLLVITLTCSFKWALVAGIAGLIVGGFLFGLFIDSGEVY